MNINKQKLFVQAVRYGVLSAVLGCAIFVFLEETRLIVRFGFDGDLEFAIMLFVFGSILASIATVISSCLLALSLYNQNIENRLPLSKSIILGCISGLITGIGLSVLGVILTNGRGSLTLYLWHTLEVAVIATLCGGWTGSKLASYIQSQEARLVP